MTIVDIRQAEAHLSKLVERAVGGEPIVIAVAGNPLVRVAALGAPAKHSRLGFLAGGISVPDDFDRMA